MKLNRNEMRRRILLACSLGIAICGTAQKYTNAALPVAIRVQDLLSKMTIEEKIGQLNTYFGWEMYEKSSGKLSVSDKFQKLIQSNSVGALWGTLRADPWTQKTLLNGLSVKEAAQMTNKIQQFAIANSRLHIPILLHEESPHGLMAIGATVFPTGIGAACSFDTALLRKIGQAEAEEIKMMGSHVAYGPILDLARDPRWSRVEETFGEDPFLVGEMGKSMVLGLQNGKFPVQATLKHFVAYGMSTGGQNGGPVLTGMRDIMQNVYPPFEKAVKIAGVWSIMTSYNSLDGIPSTGNKMLYTDLLRQQWKFKGSVISDLGSIEGLYSTHNVVGSLEDAAAMAINAGVDINLGNGYGVNLKKAIDNKKVTIATLDRAVSKILTQKFALGLFENPYVDENSVESHVNNAEHKQLAYDIAQSSVVLLKNDSIAGQAVLPLNKNKIKKIAIIGPNADTYYNQIGDYSAPQPSEKISTVLKGFQSQYPDITIQYVKGCAIRDTTASDIAAALKAAQTADAVILVLGGSSARDFKTEYKATGAATVSDNKTNEPIADMESGEGYDRASLSLMGDQLKLLKALSEVHKPLITIYIAGRPLLMNEANERSNALLQAWYPGEQGGNAIADLIMGKAIPSGRLSISIPYSEGTLPAYYNQLRPTMHPYVESKTNALFSFGYGLSYSKFEYKDLGTYVGNDSILVRCQVTNSGDYDAANVTELFVHQRVASSVQPDKSLKAFNKIFLKKGETQTIQLKIAKKDLEVVKADYTKTLDKGVYDFWLENGTGKIVLQASFSL